MVLPEKVYQILKWLSLVCLPAVCALWVALGKIWGFPYVAEIAGTISAIEVFIGAIIGVSQINLAIKEKN